MNPRMVALGAVVLLAAVQGAGVVAQSPSPPGPPTGPLLVIEEVRIAGPAPQWVEGVTTDTVLSVTVNNTGDSPSSGYRIDLHWVTAGGGTSWLNGGQSNSFDLSSQPLAAGTDRTHDDLPWRLQPGQQGAGFVRVVLHHPAAAPEDRSVADVHDLAVFVPAHHMTLSVDGPAQEVLPDETRFLRVHVQNHGNMGGTMDLHLLDADAGEADRLEEELEPATLTIPAFGSASSTLYIHYPFSGADTSPFSVQYRVQADTPYGRTLNATTSPVTSAGAPFPTLPDGSPATLTVLGTHDLAGESADAISRTLRLTNVGTARDTYFLTATTPEATWTVDLDQDRIALEPGRSATFTLTALLPDDLPGSSVPVHVEAISQRDAVLQRPPVTENLTARLHGPSLVLQPDRQWPEQPYAGDPALFPVRVINQGDAPTSRNGAVRLTATGLGPTPVTSTVDAPVVPAGSSATAYFDMGTYSTAGTVHVEAEWLPAGPAIAQQGLAADVDVRLADFTLTSPAPFSGMPGETVTYRSPGKAFVLRNMGSDAETVTITATAEHGTVSLLLADPVAKHLSDPQVTLAPGAQRSIPLDHALPLPAGDLQQANVTVTVRLTDRPDLSWTADLTTLIRDQTPPRMTLPEPLPHLWAYGESLPVALEVADDGAVEAVTVTRTDPSGSNSTHALARHGDGDRWTVRLLLTQVGNHTLDFTARDLAGNEATLNGFPVEVARVPPPTVHLRGPDGTAVDPSERFEVEVTDELSIASVSWRLLIPDNQTLLGGPLELGSSGRASFDLAEAPPGPAVLVVEAINEAGAHRNVTRQITVSSPMETAGPDDVDPGRDLPAPGILLAIAALAPAAAAARSASRCRDGGDGTDRTRNGQKPPIRTPSVLRCMRLRAARNDSGCGPDGARGRLLGRRQGRHP